MGSPDRRTASGASLRGRMHAGPTVAYPGRPSSRGHADEGHGIEALYRRPNTSRQNAAHKIWPYLRDRKIDRANQVWALDTKYIPMARGFVYLTEVWTGLPAKCWPTGWRSLWRAAMLSRRLRRPWQNTARRRSSTPTRAAQFTATEFIHAVLDRGIQLSMDGKGRGQLARQRVGRTRWRSVKYEEVYLKAYDSVSHARRSIANYLTWTDIAAPDTEVVMGQGRALFRVADLMWREIGPLLGYGSTASCHQHLPCTYCDQRMLYCFTCSIIDSGTSIS